MKLCHLRNYSARSICNPVTKVIVWKVGNKSLSATTKQHLLPRIASTILNNKQFRQPRYPSRPCLLNCLISCLFKHTGLSVTKLLENEWEKSMRWTWNRWIVWIAPPFTDRLLAVGAKCLIQYVGFDCLILNPGNRRHKTALWHRQSSWSVSSTGCRFMYGHFGCCHLTCP